MLRNSATGWGALAKALHWSVAVLVFLQFGLGPAAVAWRPSPTKLDLFVWHKSVGMLILLLMVVRLAWRMGNPSPALPPGIPPWEVRAARTSHLLLYALLFVLPLSGWIINSAANVPLKLFWVVPLPDITAPSKVLEESAKTAHATAVGALAVLLAVHVGAAWRHHFRNHNDVLRRMLPFVRRSD